MQWLDPAILTGILPFGILGLATFFEGPLALLAAGAGIAVGKLLPLPTFLTVVTGNLTADLAWYSLGRFGKKEWLEWFILKFRIDREAINRLESNIHKLAPKLVFLSKFTIGLPIPTLITVGLNRVALRRWIVLLVLGELIKSALFLTVGYLYAEGIQQTYGSIQLILWAVTVIIVAAVTIYFKFHKNIGPMSS